MSSGITSNSTCVGYSNSITEQYSVGSNFYPQNGSLRRLYFAPIFMASSGLVIASSILATFSRWFARNVSNFYARLLLLRLSILFFHVSSSSMRRDLSIHSLKPRWVRYGSSPWIRSPSLFSSLFAFFFTIRRITPIIFSTRIAFAPMSFYSS